MTLFIWSFISKISHLFRRFSWTAVTFVVPYQCIWNDTLFFSVFVNEITHIKMSRLVHGIDMIFLFIYSWNLQPRLSNNISTVWPVHWNPTFSFGMSFVIGSSSWGVWSMSECPTKLYIRISGTRCLTLSKGLVNGWQLCHKAWISWLLVSHFKMSQVEWTKLASATL